MLKNTPMKLLAIAFALSVFGGCVEQDGTPVGVDDIEDNSDSNYGPGTLKDDVDPAEPKPREVTSNETIGDFCRAGDTVCADVQIKQRDRAIKAPALNTVPQR